MERSRPGLMSILAMSSGFASAAILVQGFAEQLRRLPVERGPVYARAQVHGRQGARSWEKPLSPAARRRQKTKSHWLNGLPVHPSDAARLEAAAARRGPRREAYLG